MDSKTANGKDRLFIHACPHLLPELKKVLDAGDYPDTEIAPFAPPCGHPQKAENFRDRVFAACELSSDDQVFVLGSCCPAGMERGSSLPSRCRLLREDQCFYHFADANLIDQLMDEGAYILTPGWLSRWRAQLDQWGFDQPTARDFFNEGMSRLVLLDTGVSPDCARQLEEFASYVSLPCRTIFIGLDHFSLVIDRVVTRWRLEKTEAELNCCRDEMTKRKADEAMTLDIIAGMTRLSSENEAVGRIMELFDMLFAPRNIVYASVQQGRVASCRSRSGDAPAALTCQEWLDSGWGSDADEDLPDSLRLRIVFRDEVMGLVLIGGIEETGRIREYRQTALPLTDVCGLAVSNARMYQDLHRVATTDPLTSINNRRQFFELAEQEFSRALRYDSQLTALMMDIDHFKKINDTWGHQAGDLVIVTVARTFSSVLRSSDICGRYGGEEFAVLMPETGLDTAMMVADRIRAAVESQVILFQGLEIRVTISLGAAARTADAPNIHTLLSFSDQALYRAKEGGRNRVCAWEKEC